MATDGNQRGSFCIKLSNHYGGTPETNISNYINFKVNVKVNFKVKTKGKKTEGVLLVGDEFRAATGAQE